MKRAGFNKNTWSAALKCAFRIKDVVPENRMHSKVYQFVKKDGSQRSITGFEAYMPNATTIRMRDLNDAAQIKSFRIWQLLPVEDQPIS